MKLHWLHIAQLTVICSMIGLLIDEIRDWQKCANLKYKPYLNLHLFLNVTTTTYWSFNSTLTSSFIKDTF